jgi:hypothetical protein
MVRPRRVIAVGLLQFDEDPPSLKYGRGFELIKTTLKRKWAPDGSLSAGRPLLTRRLPPRTTLPGARIHISHKVLGRTRKLGFMGVAQTATTTSRSDPNAR